VGQVFVPAGSFMMGSDEDDPAADADEFPPHRVSLDAFWLDRTEVTNAQYEAFDPAHKQWRGNAGVSKAEQEGISWVLNDSGVFTYVERIDWRHPFGPLSNIDNLQAHPVLMVSWDDANAYCGWRGARLPTEAEWEYAARGPDSLMYPWGDTFDGTMLNYCDSNCPFDWRDASMNDGYERTTPVGTYGVRGGSWVGALDMSGNVWEWVSDWYDSNYYQNSPAENPTGPETGSNRVLRGGAWSGTIQYSRAAVRNDIFIELRNVDVGIRCVQE